ncbi:biotin transport system substrate-specific component [Methanolinea mesophila]|uniref:biotin transporter BioY n=1 Tax=Methanolinea mesophila TaxID=547055 RepID=UPI001AE8582E|nr:biotin transporter BioY [Methanolinea mesophila]MBP1929303.1 biotin transport system substrate-specific component [Methanolinea mesophila]
MQDTRDRALLITRTAAFTGLIAVGAWISVPFFPVPLTFQTLFVLLAGAVMRRYAVIPASLYLLLGALNLPVFHNGTAGLGILLGPTGGYMVGFVPAALIVGLAYEQERKSIRIAGLIGGSASIYAFGTVWLAFSAGLPLYEALVIGVIPFIPGDILKAYAAYLIADRLERRRWPHLPGGNGGAGT